MHARTSVALTCPSATRRSLSTGISIPARQQQQQHGGLRFAAVCVQGIIISSWVPGVLEAKSWGTHIRLGTTVGDAACRSMLILVVLLWFSCYMVLLLLIRASADNIQLCCWLSVPIGGSGGTAVKSAALLAVPVGSAVLACCGHRLLPRQLAVLPDGMVPGSICPGMYTYITLDNSLLNMPIGMSIRWDIAYRYLLTRSIGMRICQSIPIAWTNRSREIGTIGYCS